MRRQAERQRGRTTEIEGETSESEENEYEAGKVERVRGRALGERLYVCERQCTCEREQRARAERPRAIETTDA